MKAILFPYWFEAPDELNEFCKSIGYENPDYSDFEIMFDPRVVAFCEERLTPLWDEKVYKGRETIKCRVGFAGAGYIRDVDTDKHWVLKYSNVDAPIIDYINVCSNKFGYVYFNRRSDTYVGI